MAIEILDILKEKNSAVLQVGSIFYWKNTKYKVLHIEEQKINDTEETHMLLKVKVINT